MLLNDGDLQAIWLTVRLATMVTANLGQSGPGKTTLLRCIAGLERAERGFLSFNGEVWQDGQTFLPTHKRPLGYVFQEASLFPHLTVMGNQRYGLTRSKAEQNVSLDHAIELLGIGALLERKPERLSGGERQRVGIARALAVSPRILLMDEPLAALDLARKQEILPYLERLRDELEIPLLYVTHSPDEVGRLANHLVALKGGTVVAQGPLAETLARIDLPIRLGEERGVVLEGVVASGGQQPDVETGKGTVLSIISYERKEPGKLIAAPALLFFYYSMLTKCRMQFLVVLLLPTEMVFDLKSLLPCNVSLFCGKIKSLSL